MHQISAIFTAQVAKCSLTLSSQFRPRHGTLTAWMSCSDGWPRRPLCSCGCVLDQVVGKILGCYRLVSVGHFNFLVFRDTSCCTTSNKINKKLSGQTLKISETETRKKTFNMSHLSWNKAIWMKYFRLNGIRHLLNASLLSSKARFLLLKETVGFTLQWIIHNSFLITAHSARISVFYLHHIEIFFVSV